MVEERTAGDVDPPTGGVAGAGFSPTWAAAAIPAEQPHVQYVPDIRYIDATVCRLRDANGDYGHLDENNQPDSDGMEEVAYFTNDANMNVTALVDGTPGSLTAGQVVERYVYSAYGAQTVLGRGD